jgi:hypothetical protein
MAEAKQRHFLLSFWMFILILVNFAKALFSFYDEPHTLHIIYPTAPMWYPYVIGSCSIFSIICILALFKWSIWGFWGYCFSDIIQIFLNLTFHISRVGHNIVLPVIFILLLFLTLQLGGKNKAWNQLHY